MTELAQANSQETLPPECPTDRTFVPQDLRKNVLQQVYSSLSSGHPGISATFHLHNSFWWPTMRADTIKFIHECITCNTSKSPIQLTASITSSSSTMVPHCHRLHYRSPEIQWQYYNTHRHRSLLQGLSFNSTSQAAHSV